MTGAARTRARAPWRPPAPEAPPPGSLAAAGQLRTLAAAPPPPPAPGGRRRIEREHLRAAPCASWGRLRPGGAAGKPGGKIKYYRNTQNVAFNTILVTSDIYYYFKTSKLLDFLHGDYSPLKCVSGSGYYNSYYVIFNIFSILFFTDFLSIIIA